MKREASEAGRDRYDEIAAALGAAPGVTATRMFGMPSLKVGGKAFAGYHDGGMAFKLPPAAREGALRLEGAGLFDPSRMGRPMKEWVHVPAAAAAAWHDLAELALRHAGSG